MSNATHLTHVIPHNTHPSLLLTTHLTSHYSSRRATPLISLTHTHLISHQTIHRPTRTRKPILCGRCSTQNLLRAWSPCGRGWLGPLWSRLACCVAGAGFGYGVRRRPGPSAMPVVPGSFPDNHQAPNRGPAPNAVGVRGRPVRLVLGGVETQTSCS